MGTKATYRNALRSKRLLREAFSELVVEKGFEKVTVRQVAERADLNRSTFYAHYADLYELADELTGEITKQAFDIIDQVADGTFLADPRRVLESVGARLQQDRKLYATLLLTEGAGAFLESMRREVHVRIRRLVGQTAGAELTPRVSATVNYLAGGLFCIYSTWLLCDYDDLTIDEVTGIAVSCVIATAPLITGPVRHGAPAS